MALVHYLEAEVGSVEQVTPWVHHMPFATSDGLIEVEPVEVERHGGDAEGGKPDTNDGQRCEEEVK